ncbi:MAG: Fur family transcriptional regulator [Pseudomonadota bacterium]
MQTHDHQDCVTRVIDTVENVCTERGLKLTPVRRRVLEVLLENHAAMGAYEILRRLDEEGMGAQPPVAYRALDFLEKNGFAHKIERLNAFVACMHPGVGHAPAFMICRNCKAVAEGHAEPPENLTPWAEASGFRIERTVVEAIGLCPSCQNDAA